jgi:hypothetical protein
MIGTYALAVIDVAVWGLFTLFGLSAMANVGSRHLPGYPSAGQTGYYVAMPAALVTLTAVLTAWLFHKRGRLSERDVWLGRGSLVAILALLLPYVFFYTGGI